LEDAKQGEGRAKERGALAEEDSGSDKRERGGEERALTNVFALDFFIFDGAGQIEPVGARRGVIGLGIGFGENGAHGRRGGEEERTRKGREGKEGRRRDGGGGGREETSRERRDKP
jgi:hypothetical protein